MSCHGATSLANPFGHCNRMPACLPIEGFDSPFRPVLLSLLTLLRSLSYRVLSCRHLPYSGTNCQSKQQVLLIATLLILIPTKPARLATPVLPPAPPVEAVAHTKLCVSSSIPRAITVWASWLASSAPSLSQACSPCDQGQQRKPAHGPPNRFSRNISMQVYLPASSSTLLTTLLPPSNPDILFHTHRFQHLTDGPQLEPSRPPLLYGFPLSPIANG
jgi:hypothetical protein